MAKKTDGGCGVLILIGIVFFLISRCSGDDAGPTRGGQTGSVDFAVAPTLTEQYVTTRTLNCRAEPSTTGRIVTSLSRPDRVTVQTIEGDWSRVVAPAGSCWVSSAFLSTMIPERELEPTEPSYAPLPASLRPEEPASESFQCGAKRVCGEMNSCAEANYHLDQCGLSRLDGDGDGVPCESICG